MKLKNEYKEVFESMGYDVELKGAIFFQSLMDGVCELLNKGIEDQEIKKLLPRYYLEDYHFFFEISKERYFKELCEFGLSINKKNDKKTTKINDFNLENTLLFLSKMVNNKEEKSKEFMKVQYQ